MNEKSWILILTHGNVGEAFVESAEMIMGTLANVQAFSLLPGMSPEEFIEMIKVKLDTLPKGVLVLTDLFGGTPFNAAIALSGHYDINVVSGVNISMIIEGDLLRNDLSGRELAEAVQQVGMKACCVADLPQQKNIK
ncbi:MAG: fructose transporter subunit [Firmicutes bacterium]|nr:fructose transporter subunit [Bacillota bacterium]